ncbi:MAG TPA: hypothetical protein VJC03_03070, partial [bacterium]|nr:hypothetical protein [bacterium]
MRNLFLFSALLCFLPYTLQSVQSVEDAGLAGEHLTTYSASAEGTALGKAQTGASGMAYLVYWNPAGIYGVDRPQVHFLLSELTEGSQWQFFSFARRLHNKLYIGLARAELGTEDIETTDLLGNVQGFIGEKRTAYYLTAALPVIPDLVVGASFKVIYHNLGVYHDAAYGADIGIQYKLFHRANLGASLQNILPPRLKLKSEYEKYPMNLKSGLQLPFTMMKKKFDLFFDASLLNLFGSQKPTRLNSGLRAGLNDLIDLNLGYEKRGFSGGFSLRLKEWSLNYGVTFEDLGAVHHFDL